MTGLAHASEAIVLHQPGGPDALVLEAISVPDPGPGQLLIRQSAASVNFHDVYVRSGAYRTLVGGGHLPGTRGIARTAEDHRRGTLIESLLCRGRATIEPDLAAAAAERLAPFIGRGLVRREADELVLEPGSEPYARSIAAVFDAYRVGQRQFSSAV